jgi:hypothetical protein
LRIREAIKRAAKSEFGAARLQKRI